MSDAAHLNILGGSCVVDARAVLCCGAQGTKNATALFTLQNCLTKTSTLPPQNQHDRDHHNAARMRTRRYAWDLDIQGSDDASPLLDGLPRPSRRRRITTPPAAGSDDESGASSCGSGHTTDDSSIGSAPLEDGKQQPKNAQEQQPSQRQRRRAQRGKAALVLGMIRMSDEFMDNYTGTISMVVGDRPASAAESIDVFLKN